jgi:hypothetical protein
MVNLVANICWFRVNDSSLDRLDLSQSLRLLDTVTRHFIPEGQKFRSTAFQRLKSEFI